MRKKSIFGNDNIKVKKLAKNTKKKIPLVKYKKRLLITAK
jgi:hypothetical protein